MNKKQLSILIAALFVAAPVLAQSGDDPFRATGSITAGGIVTDTSGRDTSKFDEYQDLSNGMLSNIGVTGRNSKSWIDAYGENFGRDDMYVNLRGGMYDVFKARAYTNWMPHNFLYNGLTPFTGSGSNNLSATFPSPNTATWQNLDLGYQRKDTGGSFEWQSKSPWYFRVDGNQVKTQGTKNGGSSQGTSPGNGYVDLALPVQYETNNVTGEVGYATRTMTFSGSYLASNFGNSNEVVHWNNGFYNNGKDETYLPPANNYQRVALNATFRELPLKSTLAMRYTWDETTSDANVGTSFLGTGGALIPTNPSSGVYNGNQERQTFTLGWAATPVANLDTRVYLNWQKMNNSSTELTFADGATNHLWDYKKDNAGVDAYYRFSRANRIGGGYDYNHITQNRRDFDDTSSNTFWAEWRNNSIDTLTARIKYSYLDRSSTFLLSNAGANANDVLYMQRFVRRYDLADLTQNRVKATLDWAPTDNTGVAVEFIWKDNDYGGTTLGRTSDDAHRDLRQPDLRRAVVVAGQPVRRLRDGQGRVLPPLRGRRLVQCDHRAQLLRSEQPAFVVFVQLEQRRQEQQLADRRGRRPAGERPLHADRLVPVRADRRQLGHGGAEQLRQPAAAAQLSERQDDLAEPQGQLQVRQELVDDPGLRLPEVRVLGRPVQRLRPHRRGAVDGTGVAKLPERLERVHALRREHLLPARHLPLLTPSPSGKGRTRMGAASFFPEAGNRWPVRARDDPRQGAQ